jgi:F-type H+-transporting ATPase subunit epsilon
MAETIVFELVTPEKLVLSVEAEMVVAPGAEGDFAVLKGHAPFVSSLRPGAIEIFEGERIAERIFVAGGVAEVANDRFTILAEQAIPVAELDRAALEAAIGDAREDWQDAKTEAERARVQENIDQLQTMLDTLAV